MKISEAIQRLNEIKIEAAGVDLELRVEDSVHGIKRVAPVDEMEHCAMRHPDGRTEYFVAITHLLS